MHATSSAQQPHLYLAQQRLYGCTVLEQGSLLAPSGHLTVLAPHSLALN